MNRQPYTYLLHHIPTNTWYYGVRWANGCKPDELWVSYFTSSNRVKALRDEYGDNSFEHEVRRKFDSVFSARDWEYKVLRRMKVISKPDQWLNRTDNKAIFNDVESTRRGQIKRVKTLRQRGSLMGDKNPRYGEHIGQLQKLAISVASKRLKWWTDGNKNIRLDLSEMPPPGWWNSRTFPHKPNGDFACQTI